MIYDIRQTTTYHYASAVAYARHVLRLMPIDRLGQRVHAAALDIEPAPIERREGHDFFGNRMTWIELNQPHDTLSVRVAARVAVKRDVTPEATPPWEEIREAAFASIDLSPNSPAHYLFPSRQVSLDPEIRAYAADSFSAGRPVLDAAVDLMRRIKADFVYEIGATTASTTPPMSFALRRGVCQDFAQVLKSHVFGRKSRILRLRANERLTLSLVCLREGRTTHGAIQRVRGRFLWQRAAFYSRSRIRPTPHRADGEL